MVGAGNICEYHVAAVKALPDVELVGVTDLDPSAPSTPPRSGTRRRSRSLEALVEAGANVIHVLTPPSAHAAVALEALERGCHVLVEKPVAESAGGRASASASWRARRASWRRVDHSLLYDPQVLRALEQVRAGAIGEVVAWTSSAAPSTRRTRAARCRLSTATPATRGATSACTAST